MGIAHRDTYKALQTLKFCMQVRWGCAALSQERAAFSQASKAMLVFREISLMLCNRAVCSVYSVYTIHMTTLRWSSYQLSTTAAGFMS